MVNGEEIRGMLPLYTNNYSGQISLHFQTVIGFIIFFKFLCLSFANVECT